MAKASSKKATPQKATKKTSGKKAATKKASTKKAEATSERLARVVLRWFRGAGAEVALPLEGRSAVVFGPNGAGKSSFVDALEHALVGGKIQHLSHEYSGTNQKLGVVNTHCPDGEVAGYELVCQDGATLSTTIARSGQFVPSGDAVSRLAGWDYGRVVLRQDEVSRFIHVTKTYKYSALLPLLGLGELEQAADNLRKLLKSIDKVGAIAKRQGQLVAVDDQRQQVFAGVSDAKIRGMLAELFTEYCGRSPKGSVVDQLPDLFRALQRRAASQTDEQLLHASLRALAEVDLAAGVSAVRSAAASFASSGPGISSEVLEILAKTARFCADLEAAQELPCPACGRAILARELAAHVDGERERLLEQQQAHRSWKQALAQLANAVNVLRGESTALARQWLVRERGMQAAVDALELVDVEGLRGGAEEQTLASLLEALSPLCEAAAEQAASAPPEASKLIDDQRCLDAGKSILEAAGEQDGLNQALALRAFVERLEVALRDEIRQRAGGRIDAISADISQMWSTLHPGEAIESIRLHMPEGTDKAIDIALSFFGVDQASPRLTLSEGHRNSLGLCIFLAMALQDDSDRPLVLDDVVVSLDREHRAALVELLAERFAGRQLVLLTHDRAWYDELCQQLSTDAWSFHRLQPFDGPESGIRWA
jgi:ABC-type hemin transport system ATPase subunit